MNQGRELKAKEAEFRITLVDGHEYIRPALAEVDLPRQVQRLLSGGYVREPKEDGSMTFHVAARVASITAQRKGTGVPKKAARASKAATR